MTQENFIWLGNQNIWTQCPQTVSNPIDRNVIFFKSYNGLDWVTILLIGVFVVKVFKSAKLECSLKQWFWSIFCTIFILIFAYFAVNHH